MVRLCAASLAASAAVLADATSVFDVADYGAVGDGVADDSAAIRAAFGDCDAAGGGEVRFGPGRYLTAPWDVTCSNSVVYLHPDATVVAPSTSEDWPLGPDCPEPSQGKTSKQAKPFVLMEGLRNVTLTGGGTLDASGEMFWQEHCGNWWCPKWSNATAEQPHAFRPFMLRIDRSEAVTVDNVSFVNPAFWCIVPTYSKNVVIRNSRVTASTSSGSLDTPNTDGIEPMWSTGVHVQNVHVTNGDDCVTIKSGSRDVLVEDMTCEHSHGITVGSVWYDDVTNVTYRNIALKNTRAGPRIKGRSQGNATISNIRFENITMDGVKTGVQINMLYETPGSVDTNIGCTVKNATVAGLTGSASEAGDIACLKTRPCGGISLQDVRITQSSGWKCADATTGAIEDVTPQFPGCSVSPAPPPPVPALPGWACEPGQGALDEASWETNDTSETLCASLCEADSACVAFDNTRASEHDSCRLYPRDAPRLDGHSDAREYCTRSPDAACSPSACVARCVAEYAEPFSARGAAYMCSKACARVDHGEVLDPTYYCIIAAEGRQAQCEAECDGASSKAANIEACKFGCGFWAQRAWI